MVTRQYILNENDFITYDELSDLAIQLHYMTQISLEDDPEKSFVCYDSLEIKGLNIEVAKELSKYGYHVYYQDYIGNDKKSVMGLIIINANRDTFYSNIGSLIVDTFPLGFEAEEYLDGFEDDEFYYIFDSCFTPFVPSLFSDDEILLMFLRATGFAYIYSRLSSDDYDILDLETLIFLEELTYDESELISDYSYILFNLF